jgi:8-oxo-dGTP diphosphatase
MTHHFRPTAGVLLQRDGRVLLVRRGGEPARGKWDVPGGFLEPGEHPEEAARREIREELGVEIGSPRLLFAELNPLPDGTTVLDLIHVATFAGEPIAGDDAAEIGWFAWDALPEDLAFATTRRILDRARRLGLGLGVGLGLGLGRSLRLPNGESIVLDSATVRASFAAPLGAMPRGWRVESGEWSVHEGALCGRMDGARPAAFWLDQELRGDHAIAFEAMTVAPAVQDINCYWEGSGRVLGGGSGDVACTIAGVGGWGGSFTGIERHPAERPRHLSGMIALQPGVPRAIVAGRRGDCDFLFVDGELVASVQDPAAPRRPVSRVALATWDSHVHVLRASAHELRASAHELRASAHEIR